MCKVCRPLHPLRSSSIIGNPLPPIGNICRVADSRHFIEDTPQGELPAKAPLSLEAFCMTQEGRTGQGKPCQGELPAKAPLLLKAFCMTQEGRAKANHVRHIPANMMTLPPEAKLLESHQMATMTPSSRGHTMDPTSTDALALHTGSKSADILSKSGKLCSCNFTIVIKEQETTSFCECN